MVVLVHQDFETLTTPLKNTPNGFIPPFAGDIGDGEATNPNVAQQWVIDKNDNPSLGRLPPMGFIQGNKCVWGRLEPDPAWSTECFLMKTPEGAMKLYVKWQQAFRWLKLAPVPIFWNYNRRVNNSTGETQYTMPMAMIWLGNGSLSASAESDSGLNFDGATIYPHQVKALTWHTFEFYYEYGNPGKWWLKLDGALVIEYVGKTMSSMPGYTYDNTIQGFEVGMQSTWLNAGDYREYWMDIIHAEDSLPGVQQVRTNISSNPPGLMFDLGKVS